VGPHALSGKKELREQGVKNFVRPSVCLERSKEEEAWGEKVKGIINRVKYVFCAY
jgi:hypothetical protein